MNTYKLQKRYLVNKWGLYGWGLEKRDIWIGLCWNYELDRGIWLYYVCLIPCFVLVFYRKRR